MAKAIIENMEREKDAGNLELGQVGKSHVTIQEPEVVLSEEEVFREEMVLGSNSVREETPMELVMAPPQVPPEEGNEIVKHEVGDANSFVG